MNQAKGSRYQGLMEMRYRLADMDTREVTTAPHALRGLSSNTWRRAGGGGRGEGWVRGIG
jgi:hypothetical protein